MTRDHGATQSVQLHVIMYKLTWTVQDDYLCGRSLTSKKDVKESLSSGSSGSKLVYKKCVGVRVNVCVCACECVSMKMYVLAKADTYL